MTFLTRLSLANRGLAYLQLALYLVGEIRLAAPFDNFSATIFGNPSHREVSGFRGHHTASGSRYRAPLLGDILNLNKRLTRLQ